ncbi:MAG: hypothetical protein IJV48_00245 [Ruminococcus sp.]|nr:hypothetical protein [Ruminococcus sp.]
MSMAAGCTPPEILSPTEAAAVAATEREKLPFDETEWEHVVDQYDDDIGIGGSVIPDLYDYCLAAIVAKVTEWTEHGCEAEVIVPYEVDYYTDVRQEHYFLQEICGRLKAGDTVSVSFADRSLIVNGDHRYTAWEHGVPNDGDFPAGTVVSLGVSRIEADHQIISDFIANNGYVGENDISVARVDLQEWNMEDGWGATMKPLSELPYAVVRLRSWSVNNQRVFSFSCDILDKSDNLTWTPLSVINQGNIMYALPEQDIVGFNPPSPDDFPEGTVLKIYYVEDTRQPVYIEPIEWNE